MKRLVLVFVIASSISAPAFAYSLRGSSDDSESSGLSSLIGYKSESSYGWQDGRGI